MILRNYRGQYEHKYKSTPGQIIQKRQFSDRADISLTCDFEIWSALSQSQSISSSHVIGWPILNMVRIKMASIYSCPGIWRIGFELIESLNLRSSNLDRSKSGHHELFLQPFISTADRASVCPKLSPETVSLCRPVVSYYLYRIQRNVRSIQWNSVKVVPYNELKIHTFGNNPLNFSHLNESSDAEWKPICE